MRDTDFYQQILGIESPWRVARVDLRLKEGSVDVYVEHAAGERFPCPECAVPGSVYDHGEERQWRHLDTCQYRTVLHARPPRIQCGEHGVKQAALPWAGPRSRFTAMFERFAIDVMRETSVSAAAKILRLSWDEAWSIQRRAVQRGMARRKDAPLRRVGVDEKSARKGHNYLTLVSDQEEGTVRWIGEGRKAETLDAFWKSLQPEQLADVQSVAMDMSQAYFGSTVRNVPGAIDKIVHDRFHIQHHMNEAVDKVRRNEHAALMREGDTTLEKSRWIWLYARENLPAKYSERFAELRRITLKTGKAWMLKEDLRWLWKQPDLAAGKAFLRRWINWARRTGLQPLRRVASTLKGHAHNVLTYFKHPVTNAGAESINAAIERVRMRAAGYRNTENFKTAIYFHCGGLDLYPALPATH